jgi:hypothetical protein
MVATNAIRDEKLSSARSPYPLRSSSQSSLLLRSPLRTPRRRARINLVSGTTDAATSMSGVENDPEVQIDLVKLDQLLRLVATMNTWLDRQSQRLTMVEAAIPLLAHACGVVLLPRSGGATGNTPSTGTDAGSGVGGGTGGAPAAGDVPNPDDEPATVGEPARTGGMGPGRGGGFGMALEARVVVVARAILEAHDLGNQTHCRGSTNAPPTSAAWVHLQTSRSGWPHSTLMGSGLSGFTPSNAMWAPSCGSGSRTLSTCGSAPLFATMCWPS